MAEVRHLFICLVHRFPMKELEEVEAVENKGFEGCIHGRGGSSRQVSLMDSETLGRLVIPAGAVKENITTQGVDFHTLKIAQRLRIGEALLQITGPCEPCSRMDEIRMGLQEELRGQRGWLCRVIEPGKIRRGEGIEVMALESIISA
ncbi:MAG: MOSC domain-containing protein [Candidatus Acidiferrales bacterium]